MSAKSNDLKLGLFVLIGLGLFAVAIFLLMGARFFFGNNIGETYVTGNVEGLKNGGAVTLRGVPVGQITRINFTWNEYHHPELHYVLIEFSVHKDVSPAPAEKDFNEQLEQQVKQGLRARVKSQGLAGATILSLEYLNPAQYPPLQVPWTPHHTYIPCAPSELTEIMSSLDQTLGRIKQMDFEQLGSRLQHDLAAGETLLKHLDEANVTGLSTNANALLADLRHVSAQLSAFLGQTNAAMHQATLEKVSSDADQTLVELRGVLRRMDHLLANFDAGALNETLGNLRRTSEQLEATVTKLQEYPSGVLFGKPPPPAKSVQRAAR
jgi:paraquat-inducible protein B